MTDEAARIAGSQAMKADLAELVARVEAASGPDRELDAEVYAMLNPHMKQITPKAKYLGRFFDPTKTTNLTARDYHISGGATGLAPRYTASLDAAMTLVPEGYAVGFKRAPCQGSHAMMATIGYEANASGATPALAIVAAALRARGG